VTRAEDRVQRRAKLVGEGGEKTRPSFRLARSASLRALGVRWPKAFRARSHLAQVLFGAFSVRSHRGWIDDHLNGAVGGEDGGENVFVASARSRRAGY